MGCKPSTTLNAMNGGGPPSQEDLLSKRYKENLKGIGQTERQLSKMQRAAMNDLLPHVDNDDNTADEKKAASKKKRTISIKPPPKLDSDGHLSAEEVAKRTFSSISNKEVTLGTSRNVTHVQVRTRVVRLG